MSIITGEKYKSKAKSKNYDTENEFVERLVKQLNEKEVELADGSVVSNMDAIIDNMIGKAIDGDVAVIKLIRDLLNNRG